uniref:Uncharacterized protein n=1 Tax=Hemiselmis andersenii TaxID=464988 RepID=A0A6U4I0J5_HEMAN|mmetsp:Transcript_31538/g.73825  ORF Transcript_31538/g.73825 Transcript_31538/m.73825 type:complete len:205 (-) Transcript_31538:30-644(-)
MEHESFKLFKTSIAFGLPGILGLIGLYSVVVLLPGDPLGACVGEPGVNATAQPCPCWALSPVKAGAKEWQQASEPACDPLWVVGLATWLIVMSTIDVACKGMREWNATNASRAIDIRSVGMMGSVAESPQRREGLWARVWVCSACFLVAAGLSVFIFARRHWLEGGYAVCVCVPCAMAALDAWDGIRRIDRQGFLPVTLVTNRF